jgi:hypothetical protein
MHSSVLLSSGDHKKVKVVQASGVAMKAIMTMEHTATEVLMMNVIVGIVQIMTTTKVVMVMKMIRLVGSY